MCSDACPETAAQVLRVRKLTSLDTLSRGKVVLHNIQLATCKNCGASIASMTLLRRIEASLEKGNEALRTVLSQYCPSCRSAYAFGYEPSSLQDESELRKRTS
jgi:hypothetical protein